MSSQTLLSTPRLTLRRWTAGDAEPFAALNADPEVMRYFPSTMTREASDALADYADGCFDRLGFGLSAVEFEGAFVGFVGLHRMRWYPDEVEIGWRLARPVWGRGIATEAAAIWVGYARDVLRLPRLISIIHPDNAASFAVARKLGMREGWRGDSEDRPHTVMTLGL
jgi:RimJ/RimL family protein N-acetyltransferase